MENLTEEQRKIAQLEIMLDVCKRDKDALRYQLEEAKRKAAQQSAQSDLLPCGHDAKEYKQLSYSSYGCAICAATRRQSANR